MQTQKQSYSKDLHAGQRRTAILFCFPTMAILFLFTIIPFGLSVFYSFTNRMLVPRAGRTWTFIGLANYAKLFTNHTTIRAFINTGLYALIVVPFILIFGTLLAIFVNRPIRGTNVFRAIYFSPQVVTMTVVTVIWSFIFSPGTKGLLNSFLKTFGIPAQTWLQNPKQALVCIAVMYIWQAIGLQMVIILGGLQYIPSDLYEAATIDGSSFLQKFFYITIPMLKNTLVYVFISVTVTAFKVFTQVYMLTSGGPKDSTVTVVYHLYKVGFVNNQLGYSSAISTVFFLCVLAISLLQNHIVGKERP